MVLLCVKSQGWDKSPGSLFFTQELGLAVFGSVK